VSAFDDRIVERLAAPRVWGRVTPDTLLLAHVTVADPLSRHGPVRAAIWGLILAGDDADLAFNAASCKLQLDVIELYERGARVLRVPPRHDRRRTVCVSPLQYLAEARTLTCYLGVARI
jgi:hypothetical protein